MNRISFRLPFGDKLLKSSIQSVFTECVVEHSEDQFSFCRAGVVLDDGVLPMWVTFAEFIVKGVQHSHWPVVDCFLSFAYLLIKCYSKVAVNSDVFTFRVV